MIEERHIVKYKHTQNWQFWCGELMNYADPKWVFMDTDHALVSADQNSVIKPCRKCMEAINEVVQGCLEEE